MRNLYLTTVLVMMTVLAAVSVNAQRFVQPPPMVPVKAMSPDADLPSGFDIPDLSDDNDSIVRHSVYCGFFANRFRASQVAYQPVAAQTYLGGCVDNCDCVPTSFAGPVADPCATAAVVPNAYPPQVLPPQAYAPQAYSPPPIAPQPPVILGQNPPGLGTGSPGHYIGRGIIGQPKLYVAGQPVRNALRFITP